MSDYLELSEGERERLLEAGIQRALAEPIPAELRDVIKDTIEPHTINMQIKHRDVMECIRVAFPVIRDWLREHPEAGGQP